MAKAKKRITPGVAAGLILLGVLIAAAVVMAVRVRRVNDEWTTLAATTYTPAPTAFNVMQTTPDPDATAIVVLRSGSQGDDVTRLQQQLQVLGYYTDTVDGQYGALTQDAVQRFQQMNDLEADGIAGRETLALLYSGSAEPAPTATPAPTDTPEPTPIPESALPFYTEDGMPLLVNSTHPLPESYTPVELVNMTDYCDSSVVKIKANGIEGERIAVDALQEMLRAAIADGLSNWQVSAGWRSVSYQQTLFDKQVAKYKEQGMSTSKATAATKKLVAVPGCSEHHLGLAFDITVPGTSFGSTKQAAWIAEHCWEYGFILRYPQGKSDITGIQNEPWHFRYVGTEHSLIMRDEDLCLEEYIEQYGTYVYPDSGS